MRLLLDTHILLWWLGDDDRLDLDTREVIGDPSHTISVSAASAWEIAIKSSLGKLSVPGDLEDELRTQGFDQLPVAVTDGLVAGGLPRHHDDPFDRMLIAQAQRRDLVIATADRRFAEYDVRLFDPPSESSTLQPRSGDDPLS